MTKKESNKSSHLLLCSGTVSFGRAVPDLLDYQHVSEIKYRDILK